MRLVFRVEICHSKLCRASQPRESSRVTTVAVLSEGIAYRAIITPFESSWCTALLANRIERIHRVTPSIRQPNFFCLIIGHIWSHLVVGSMVEDDVTTVSQHK